MLSRLLRVARPDDWTGTLSRLAITAALVLLVVVAALVRLPTAWVALAGGQHLVVRLSLLVVALSLLAIARVVLVSRLPRAVVLLPRSVRFHDGARRICVRIRDIAALHVEQRPEPAHEVFVIEERNGIEHDLCPTHWWGAPALHRLLERRVAAASRRRARERRRAAQGVVEASRPSST